MAINKIDQPDAATPTGNDDYTQQNLLINGNISITDLVITDWAGIVSIPAIKEGTYFVHSGNLYQTQTSDENITGTISNGLNYIAMSVSGTTLVPSYITSLSGYTWNPAYGGMYNGTTLAIPAVVFLSGTNYYRGRSLDKSLSGNIIYANGDMVCGGGVSVPGNANITGSVTSGGNGSFNGDVSSGGDLTYDGEFFPSESVDRLIYNLTASQTVVLPRGLYIFYIIGSSHVIEITGSGGWWVVAEGGYPQCITVLSDGSNARLRETIGSPSFTSLAKKY